MNGRGGKGYIKNKTRHELNYFYHSYSKTMTYRSIYMLFYVFEIVFFFFRIFSKWKVDLIRFKSDSKKSAPMLLSGSHVCILTSPIAHLLCITPYYIKHPCHILPFLIKIPYWGIALSRIYYYIFVFLRFSIFKNVDIFWGGVLRFCKYYYFITSIFLPIFFFSFPNE